MALGFGRGGESERREIQQVTSPPRPHTPGYIGVCDQGQGDQVAREALELGCVLGVAARNLPASGIRV